MGSPVFFYPLKGDCAVYLRRYLRRYKLVLPTGHLSFGLHLLRRIIARYINLVSEKMQQSFFCAWAFRISLPLLLPSIFLAIDKRPTHMIKYDYSICFYLLQTYFNKRRLLFASLLQKQKAEQAVWFWKIPIFTAVKNTKNNLCVFSYFFSKSNR